MSSAIEKRRAQVILDLPGLELERCGELTTLSARIERLGDDQLTDATT